MTEYKIFWGGMTTQLFAFNVITTIVRHVTFDVMSPTFKDLQSSIISLRYA